MLLSHLPVGTTIGHREAFGLVASRVHNARNAISTAAR